GSRSRQDSSSASVPHRLRSAIRRTPMIVRGARSSLCLVAALLVPSILIAVMPQTPTTTVDRRSAQDWPFGPYQIVANWPKPLPDTRHSHNGWTWGSMGSVFAETPDRIWVAQRGELPLPEGTAPWTPYAALNPTRGNSNSNTDGLSATCQPAPLRGW